MFRKIALSLLVFGTLFFTSIVSIVFADDDQCCRDRQDYVPVEVSGTAVHDFESRVVHHSEQIASGRLETTTETINLAGDLQGRVLYQPTGVYDLANGRLVNTGRQVFSGSIRGSEPVIIFDDKFRFEVDLNTGAVRGRVFLDKSISGPRMSCELEINGSSPPVDGKSESSYAGVCWMKAKR